MRTMGMGVGVVMKVLEILVPVMGRLVAQLVVLRMQTLSRMVQTMVYSLA